MKKRCVAKTSKGRRCRNVTGSMICARHRGVSDLHLADELTPAERADGEVARDALQNTLAAPARCVAATKEGLRCTKPCDKDGERLLCADHLKDARNGEPVYAASNGQSDGADIVRETRRVVRRKRPGLWAVKLITSQRGFAIAAALFVPMLLLTEVVEAIELGLPLTFLPISLDLAPMLVARAPETLLSLGLVFVLVVALLTVLVLIAATTMFFVVKPSILRIFPGLFLALTGSLIAAIASMIVGAINLMVRVLWLTIGGALRLTAFFAHLIQWSSAAMRLDRGACVSRRLGALGFFNSEWSGAAVERIWAPVAKRWRRLRSDAITNFHGTVTVAGRMLDRFFVNTMLSGRSDLSALGSRAALYLLTMFLMVELTQFSAVERIARIEAEVMNDRARTPDAGIRTASAAPPLRTASLAAPSMPVVTALEATEEHTDRGDGGSSGPCYGSISLKAQIFDWAPPFPDALRIVRTSPLEWACRLFGWLNAPPPIGRLVMKGGTSRDASFISPKGLQPRRTEADIRTADAVSGVEPETGGLPWPKELSRKVVYIGEYGDWALLAPLRGWPNDRVLVRRSDIVEFSEADDERRERVSAPLRRAGDDDDLKAILEALAALQRPTHEQIDQLGERIGAVKSDTDDLRDSFSDRLNAVARKAEDRSLARIALATARRARPTAELRAITKRLGDLERDRDAYSGTPRIWIVNHDPGHARAAWTGNGDVTRDFKRLRRDPAYRACFEEDGFAPFVIRFPLNAATAEEVWRGELEVMARKIAAGVDPNSAPTLVLIRGAASASGASDHNRRLSERRAEWVAKELKTRVLSKAPKANLLLVPFGVGERLPIRLDNGLDPDLTARNVTIRICEAAQNVESPVRGSAEEPSPRN